MIQTLQVYTSISTDPYRNLAIEEYLLDSVKKNCCILYLWQNKNTVVIGKNQNGWKECRTELLKEEGGLLARRLSGGGAVFHDLGNLNFTFLVNTEDYDVDRQLTVIQNACHLLGIDARRSGRNDLLCMERKFSGNAFYKTKEKCYHHGTLLLHADTEKMSRYLNPSAAKLKAKGVDSVRSRVLNLCEVKPDLTVDAMMSALIQSFAAVYGGEPMSLCEQDLDQRVIRELAGRYASWEWNYGRELPMDIVFSDRFSWGEITLGLQIRSGRICHVQVYSDSMDWTLPGQIEECLSGCRLDLADMIGALLSSKLSPAQQQDLAELIRQQLH